MYSICPNCTTMHIEIYTKHNQTVKQLFELASPTCKSLFSTTQSPAIRAAITIIETRYPPWMLGTLLVILACFCCFFVVVVVVVVAVVVAAGSIPGSSFLVLAEFAKKYYKETSQATKRHRIYLV